MRRRQCLALGAFVALVFCTYSALRLSDAARLARSAVPPAPNDGWPAASDAEPAPWPDEALAVSGPRPKPVADTSLHPMWHLINDARREHDAARARQSQTLADAVAEYRRRYGMAPPPHFDKWFDFARRNGVELVDEFDTIHDLLTPFWGLKPKTIRARAKEALGFDNALIGVAVRDHAVAHVAGGQEWQRNATEGMMAKFLAYLPDMDLAFNIHDEPRVVVPHEDLARLVGRARGINMPAAAAHASPANDFSPPPPELAPGRAFDETKLTRFNEFSHQPTWTHSRMSCPPESPARILDEDERADDRTKYAVSELGFVYNATAMSDICLSPSLSASFGFFDRPNAYKVVHDLFPIFSQSKISSYNDILYPSPWYWDQKVAYDEAKDKPWDAKLDRLYWRGSTTGGYSRNGGWRRQHRQHLVHKINARGRALVVADADGTDGPRWEPRRVARADYRALVDVAFSHIGQCDQGDCDAQRQHFDVKEHANQQDAWRYKFLLDMDGNAFSGRFHAFLLSRSLTFKLALFREWHAEWLRPWAHYVPLSPQGDDWLEAVRFFADAGPGRDEAEAIAAASRDWAARVLRKMDMEAWFFRLLLEYARVIDDQRAVIGFDIESPDRKLARPAPAGDADDAEPAPGLG